MKQRIDELQLMTLSEGQALALRAWFLKHRDLCDTYTGFYFSPWDKHIDLPLLSIGQMICLLAEYDQIKIEATKANFNNKKGYQVALYYSFLSESPFLTLPHELCDSLWQTVTEALGQTDQNQTAADRVLHPPKRGKDSKTDSQDKHVPVDIYYPGLTETPDIYNHMGSVSLLEEARTTIVADTPIFPGQIRGGSDLLPGDTRQTPEVTEQTKGQA